MLQIQPYLLQKLPSYGIYTEDEFRENAQVDWNSYTKLITKLEGAVYSVVEDVNKDKTLNVISHFDTKFKDNWKFNANFSYQNLKSDNFRRVKDLLGANYANNLDAFGNDLPYDVDAADTKVYEGDRTQYSYILNKNTYAINLSTEIDLPRWNVVASIFSSYSESIEMDNLETIII
jgi:hypothetical protein